MTVKRLIEQLEKYNPKAEERRLLQGLKKQPKIRWTNLIFSWTS